MACEHSICLMLVTGEPQKLLRQSIAVIFVDSYCQIFIQ